MVREVETRTTWMMGDILSMCIFGMLALGTDTLYRPCMGSEPKGLSITQKKRL